MSAPIKLERNVFVKPNSEYKCRLYPKIGYLQQATDMVQKTFDLTKEEAKTYVKDILQGADQVAPTVTYNGTDKNGDAVEKTSSLDNYIQDNLKAGNVIVPSFTVYSNPKRKSSAHTGYVLENLAGRTKEKNLYKEAVSNKDYDKAAYHQVLQLVRKVFNNSLSGAYASKSTILYHPSSHYTLTTMTRAVASVGNGITEMIVMGNRYYTSTDTVISHMTALVVNVDQEQVGRTIKDYALHVPTVDEVLTILKYSSDLYYIDKPGEVRIRKYVKGLSSTERCTVAYVNDLYQLRTFNPKLIRFLLRGLGTPYHNNLDRTTATLDASPEWLSGLVHMVCSDVIKGQKVDYKKLIGTEAFKMLTGTTERIIKTLKVYEKFIQTFFATTVLPIDIVDIKKLIRRAIVISDTDSTCGSYVDYTEWYLGKKVVNSAATGITGAVMTIVTQTMDHYLKQVSANMNIPEDKMDMLQMKNEYYWEVVVAPLASKQYYAGINIKEGNVYGEPDLEIKGPIFIASGIPARYKEKARSMYVEIIDNISNNRPIDLADYLSQVAVMEREIISELLNGNISYLKTEKIKPEGTYANDWKTSNYYHYKLWEEVFADKYGQIPAAPISTIKINTSLTSKGKIKSFIAELKDEQLKERMELFYAKHQKGSLGAFQLPVEVGSYKGIPEEIMKVLDITKVVSNICQVFYLILETCGYIKKEDVLLTDLGY